MGSREVLIRVFNAHEDAAVRQVEQRHPDRCAPPPRKRRSGLVAEDDQVDLEVAGSPRDLIGRFTYGDMSLSLYPPFCERSDPLAEDILDLSSVLEEWGVGRQGFTDYRGGTCADNGKEMHVCAASGGQVRPLSEGRTSGPCAVVT